MVYMLLGTGFEETEAIAPLDLLRRAGVEVLTVGIDGKTVIGSHKIPVVADITIGEMDLTDMEMIVIPGGLGGVASLRASRASLDALKFGWENQKYVAAICAGPTVLAQAGLLEGKKACCYPGMEEQLTGAMASTEPVVRDGSVITSRGLGTAIPFALALVAYFCGEKQAQALAKSIVFQ